MNAAPPYAYACWEHDFAPLPIAEQTTPIGVERYIVPNGNVEVALLTVLPFGDQQAWSLVDHVISPGRAAAKLGGGHVLITRIPWRPSDRNLRIAVPA